MEWTAETECALIILDESGSTISAQTGGMVCNHRSATGWHVPLSKALGLDCDLFHACVCGLARKNTSELELTQAADVIDSVLSNSLYAFKVDRTRLQELEEAWIPIVCGKNIKAILTYRNCD